MAAAVAAADEKIDKLRAAVAQLDQISRAPLPSPTSSAKSKWSNHEVRRRRDKKKETKVSQETRSRPFYKSTYRGSKAGSDRSGRFHSGFGDSTGSVKRSYQERTRVTFPTKLINLGFCQGKQSYGNDFGSWGASDLLMSISSSKSTSMDGYLTDGG